MPIAAPKTRMTGAERREQILDTTRTIVAAEGFHVVTIDGVAKAAGITRPVVYGHFTDLPGLLAALVEREGERALTQLANIVPTHSGDDPSEQLHDALRAFLEAVASDPETWRLVLMPPEGAPESLHEAIAAGRSGVGLQLARYAAPALAGSPGDESGDPELTASILQAVSEEYARLLLEQPEQYPLERLLTHARWALRRLAA